MNDISGQFDTPLLAISYDRKKVIARFLPFQIIGIIIACLLIGLESGGFDSESPTLIKSILGFGFFLYLFFSIIMLRMLIRPALITIFRDRILHVNSIATFSKIDLPAGTVVTYNISEVTISPMVIGIPNSSNKENVTYIRIPQGIKEFSDGEVTLL